MLFWSLRSARALRSALLTREHAPNLPQTTFLKTAFLKQPQSQTAQALSSLIQPERECAMHRAPALVHAALQLQVL
jgi:hypothetical protein